ncbi:hypothetical protein N0V82_006106 [Gnomoniopsis sp. IMI 355080]|nr:hypothetical protein N0V82_006106 [Gnomoniopsis sp. IMI 355080]
MLGVHSLAPAQLYAGTERKPAPKPKSNMGDVQSAVLGDANATTNPHDSDITHTRRKKELAGGPNDTTRLAQRDSGVGSTTGDSHEFSQINEDAPSTSQRTEPASWLAGEQPAASDGAQKPTTVPPPQPVTVPMENSEKRTDSIDFSNRPPTEAGPSRKRAGSSHSSLQHDAPLEQAPPRPDETHFNAIAYRRDPETVIAYLVPLPQPKLQGNNKEAVTEPKYFLYAPPPPHLLKPRNGASEGYVRKLNRHWQQQVRRAQRSEQPTGKRILPHKRLHGKVVRGMTRALGKLQTDDVTFLARIHPKTVNHLILIHPWGLSGAQTPEEVMRTFRAQMFESKKKAKRDSILSAVFFMPALAIDTLAIFFGGMAEVDGIWMLVSVTAYRTARFITRKMGPEPKTMELEQAKLIEDAKRSGFPPTPPPEAEEDSEPGAVRRSVDALRRSLGSVKYRMSMNQRRSRSRKRKGGESSSTDTSRPQTTEASRTDLEGFNRGELEDHAEENEAPTTSAAVPAAAPPSTAHSGSELSGFLEHMDEEVTDDGQPGSSSGGIFASEADGHRTSAESNNTTKSTKKKGQNFQLTFYPSPAMDVLARYVQESCHMKNGRVYSSPDIVPTEEDVLNVVGWRPERREHDSPEAQADDEEWQTRAIKNDLRQASRKAAKAWNKSCRKQAKQQRRSKKGGLLAFKWPAKKASKGKNKETTTSSDSEPTSSSTEKEARSAAIKARIAALRAKTQRKQQKKGTPAEAQDDESATTTTPPAAAQEGEEATTTTKKDKRGRAAGAAAILGAPCFAMAERVKNRRKQNASRKQSEPSSSSDSPSAEKKKNKGGAKRGAALKQRMISKRDALRQRKTKNAAADVDDAQTTATPPPVAPVGLETPTDLDEAPRDTEGEGQTTTTAAATAATNQDDQTEAGDNNAKKDKSFKGKLLAIPAGIAAAIGAVLKKRRNEKDAKKKITTTAADDLSGEPKEKKASRFSALQERFKARRTRVSKNKKSSSSSPSDTTNKQSRMSSVKERIQEMKQKRKVKKEANNSKKKSAKAATPSQEEEEEANQPKSTKEHGAVVGLVAGCVALPMAKAKQIRDKRRKTGGQQQSQPTSINTDSPTVMSGTQLSPVPEETQQQQRNNTTTATTNDESITRTTTTQAPPAYTAAAGTMNRPTTSYQSPVVEEDDEDDEEFEDPPEELPATDSQYLPGLGQSEVPVRPGPPDARLGSSDTAVEQIASANEPRPSIEAAAGGAGGRRLKAVRTGIEGFVNRRRGEGKDASGEAKVENKNKKSNEPAAAAGAAGETTPATTVGGRFQGLKDGLDGLKAKRRSAAAGGGGDAGVENEKTKSSAAAPDGEGAVTGGGGGRFKSLKGGLANMKAKKTGTEPPPTKEKVYKEGGPGFIERARWIWVMA